MQSFLSNALYSLTNSNVMGSNLHLCARAHVVSKIHSVNQVIFVLLP